MPDPKDKTPPPSIYVLATKIPAAPVEGVKTVTNFECQLGYFTKQHIAEAEAKRRNLHVVELVNAEDASI
jgi:hypothetical protein